MKDFAAIDFETILKNSKENVITQSVAGATGGDILSKNSTLPTANEYTIHWVELVDENTINLEFSIE